MSEYDEYDWSELPAEVQKAAAVLGYNAKKWDADEETDFEDCDWDELNAEQQKAAAVLGYNKQKWDESS